MNFSKFTIKAQEAVQAAIELAQNISHYSWESMACYKNLKAEGV